MKQNYSQRIWHDVPEDIFLMIAPVIKTAIRSKGILIIKNAIWNAAVKEAIVDATDPAIILNK